MSKGHQQHSQLWEGSHGRVVFSRPGGTKHLTLASSTGILSATSVATGIEVKIYSGTADCVHLYQTRSELLLSYFCGYGPGCSDPKLVSSLQRAKTAVEQQYSVVGVSEKRKISLAVMEAYLPIWFRQATSMEEERETKREMVNSHPEPSEQTRAELKRRLQLDYNFYYFCIQRLEMQWRSILRDRNKKKSPLH